MPTSVKKVGPHNYAIVRHGHVVGHSTSKAKAEASARIADQAAHGAPQAPAALMSSAVPHPVASLTVQGPGAMPARTLRRIAAWLREQAELMDHERARRDMDRDECPIGPGCMCNHPLTEGRYVASLRR